MVNKLIFLQMNLVHSMDRTKKSLPNIFGSQLDFDTAKRVERSLYTPLSSDIASEENVGVLVSSNLLSLKGKLMPEALRFNPTMQVPAEINPLIASFVGVGRMSESLVFASLCKSDSAKVSFSAFLE